MSFFGSFSKSETSDTLQYDDTAFLHFAISVCSMATVILSVLIYKDLQTQRKNNYASAQSIQYFKQRIKSSLSKRKNYFTTSRFLYKFVVVVACVSFGVFCFASINPESKMIGFDPYEILEVSMDATTSTIKKSYRKLALEYHPDRNVGNPEAASKFILISKAYECLTNPEAKQKCAKYGNPDGEVAFQVGIGLPRFMVDVKNQYFILIPIFIVLLIIIPRAFIRWSSRLRPTDANGNLIANYGVLYELITPQMNPITFSVIFGSMKELDALFTGKNVLQQKIQEGFKGLLIQTGALNAQQLQKISPQILYRCCSVYSYLANRSKMQGLADYIPEISEKIIKFTLFYAQKMNEGTRLVNNPNWTIPYYGVFPLKLALLFSKQLYNPSVRLAECKSIQFLDLNPEQQLLARNVPIGNLQDNLLWDDEKIDTLIANFQLQRQKYIKEQVQDLPALKVSSRLLLGEEEVSEMTIDDFATIEIKVSRRRANSGYVTTRDFPTMAKQQFYIIVTYNNNLMMFSELAFPDGKLEATYKVPHRQSVPRDMKFNVAIISACYPNMDIECEFGFRVLGRVENKGVILHEDDRNLEKIPKNGWEAMVSLEALTEEQKQLSEGSDTDAEERRGFVEEQEEHMHGENCNHDHGHEHEHGEHCNHDHQHQHEHEHVHGQGCKHGHQQPMLRPMQQQEQHCADC